MPLLVLWSTLNLAACLILLYRLQSAPEWYDIFIYPKIHEFLEDEEIGTVGKVFVDIIITLFLLPALLVYFAAILIALIFYVAVCALHILFVSLFGKR